MKHVKTILATVILLGVVAANLSSCKSKPKDRLIGIWKVDVANLNGTEITDVTLGDWKWEFNKEGGYMVMLAGAKEKGTYTLKDESLQLKSVTFPERPETQYAIVQLDSLEMVLKTVSDSNTTTLHFYKIK